MALSQSALSELLDAIRAGGGEDVLREAMTRVLQELIKLEAAYRSPLAAPAPTALDNDVILMTSPTWI